MRPLILVVAAAALLAGCGITDTVPLLTGDLGCYAGGENGPTALLVADPEHGTTFNGRPVMWPAGYTARRAGSEIAVLDSTGRVRAITGRSYHIAFAYVADIIPGDAAKPFPAAVDCGYPWDFVDCTANADDRYCRPDQQP